MTQASIDQTIARAVEHHQANRLREAEALYRQVLSVAPDHPDALHLLGVIALHAGKLDVARELIARAIARHPNVADFHYNLGTARMLSGQPREAAESFGRAVGLDPKHFAAHSNLAAAKMALGQFDQAIMAARVALSLQPNHSESWNNLGVALKETGKPDDAFDAFRRAVETNPQSPEALGNLGNALQQRGQLREAVEVHRQAVALRPESPDLIHNLASSLFDELEYEQSIETARKAIALRPDFAEAYCTLANAYYRLSRLDDAIAAARKAIALWPDSPLPKFNLALMLLSKGEFGEGWRMHEHRWLANAQRKPRPNFPQPQWDGSDLAGRTILLYTEQGFGDTIQFVRYVPMVRAKGARIILGCQEPLLRLLKQIDGVDQLVGKLDGTLKFDVHCPLMTLPMIFGTNLSNIPASPSYLKADPLLIESWSTRIPNDPKLLKVGIAWSGRPTHFNDRNRSIAMDLLAPLGKLQNIWWCSVQKDRSSVKIPGMSVTDFSDDMQDFADTAAIIAHLDLVISVDTAAAHLAAAMGKPTWLLLPYASDWRWLTGREDSPWYPSMRLFRQPRPRDWPAVIERVAMALRDRARTENPI